MNTFMKITAFFICVVILPSLVNAWEGKVVTVTSGDTITALKEGQPITIRLAGLDCPENDQPIGPEAKKFTIDLIANKTVKIWPAGTDQQGQTLAFIFIGNRNLNKELLSAGLAWHHKAYSRDPELAKLEFKARSKKIGLWSNPDPIAPWEWRRR